MLSVVENDYERWVSHVEETLKNDAERALKGEERMRVRLDEIAAHLRSWKREGEWLSNAQLEALALRCLEPL